MMTPVEYKKWLETRGPSGTWNMADCRAADELIKREAMESLGRYLQRTNSTAVREYVKLMVRATYGSAETDQFLQTIKAYPEWMEGGQ